jgi:hypothetical protein
VELCSKCLNEHEAHLGLQICGSSEYLLFCFCFDEIYHVKLRTNTVTESHGRKFFIGFASEKLREDVLRRAPETADGHTKFRICRL